MIRLRPPRSIRYRLTLWYVGILGLILAFFGWALYLNESSGLMKDMDKVLLLRAESVGGMIYAFREAEASTAGNAAGNWKTAPAVSFMGEVEKGHLPALVLRWARQTRRLETDRPIRVIDRYGRPIISSTRLDLPLTQRAIGEAIKGSLFFETFFRTGGRVRLVTWPVVQEGRVLYIIQASNSLNSVDMSLHRFRTWLLWLIPMTLLLASSVGWFLATQALRPVGAIVHHAQRISSQRLDERLLVPQTGDELQRLASTFNDMLARLEKDFRRSRQFSAAASHELRTPLTVMRGELEVALRKPRTAEEYQRVLRTHLAATEELSTIVEELLMLAHSEAVDRAVEWKPVDLRVLTDEIAGTWRRIAAEKAVTIQIHADGVVRVNGEERLLKRLVANLLDNAVKHTPNGGAITVRVDVSGKVVRLMVEDTGPGIPSEEMPHLFDRFFKRAGSGPTSTGLGLGLSRWIAEAHYGRIEVSSLPGKGAAFTVLLPFAGFSETSVSIPELLQS